MNLINKLRPNQFLFFVFLFTRSAQLCLGSAHEQGLSRGVCVLLQPSNVIPVGIDPFTVRRPNVHSYIYIYIYILTRLGALRQMNHAIN
jgi:hypothetical protein